MTQQKRNLLQLYKTIDLANPDMLKRIANDLMVCDMADKIRYERALKKAQQEENSELYGKHRGDLINYSDPDLAMEQMRDMEEGEEEMEE